MVQSQHKASGSVSSHAFSAGKYANVKCLKYTSKCYPLIGYKRTGFTNYCLVILIKVI